MVKLFEVVSTGGMSEKSYNLREIYINPAHVVYVREATKYKRLLNEGKLPADLDNRQEFSKISLLKGSTGLEIVVVGNTKLIMEKFNAMNDSGGKHVLRG